MGYKHGSRNDQMVEDRNYPDDTWMCELCRKFVRKDVIKGFSVSFDAGVNKYCLEWVPNLEGDIFLCDNCLKETMGLDMGED